MQRLPASPLITRALEAATTHLGIAEVCKRLNATETMIRAWADGHATMPEHTFLRLVDILMDLDPKWSEGIPK